MLAKNKRGRRAFIFPFTYDRVDVLMSAGCSTLVSAAPILIVPRVGIVLLEMLVGLSLSAARLWPGPAFAGGRNAEESLEQITGSRQESGRLIAMTLS